MTDRDQQLQAALIYSVGEKVRNHFWGNVSRKMGSPADDGQADQLSPAQLQLVEIVGAAGRITITELAGRLAVSAPSASTMVERLVKCGWLHRQRGIRDRRKVEVSVAPDAASRIDVMQSIIRREILNMLTAVGPETARKWCEVLKEIQRAGR